MKQLLLLALACHWLATTAAQSSLPPTFKWVKTITFVDNQAKAEIFDFCTDSAGNSYVYGIFSGSLNFGPGTPIQSATSIEAYFVAKYQSNGVIDWIRKVEAPGGGRIYDVDDNPCGISTDRWGNVYISGQLTNTALQFGDGVTTIQRTCPDDCSDFFVAKYDPTGQIEWVSSGTGPAHSLRTGTRLVTGTDGSVFVGGTYTGQSLQIGGALSYTGLPDGGLYMAHLSTDGQPLGAWFFGNSNGNAQLDHLTINKKNEIMATGYYKGNTPLDFGNDVKLPTYGGNLATNYFVAKYTEAGTILWAQNLNSGDYMDVLDIAADTAGQPYIVADFATSINTGSDELITSGNANYGGVLFHFDDTAFQVVTHVPYTLEELYPFDNVAVDRSNRFFVGGAFSDSQLTIDDTEVENVYCDDLLLLSGDSNQAPLNWVRSAGGGGCEGIISYYTGNTIATDWAGSLYAVGSFHSSLLLDNFARNGDGLFVTKLNNAEIIATHAPVRENVQLPVSPNPSNGRFRVEWTDFTEPAQFVLSDAQGRVHCRRTVRQAADLDFQLQLPAGLYTIEWLTAKKAGQQKLVVAH